MPFYFIKEHCGVFFFSFFFFYAAFLLWSPTWPRTHSYSPVLASQGLGLELCIVTPIIVFVLAFVASCCRFYHIKRNSWEAMMLFFSWKCNSHCDCTWLGVETTLRKVEWTVRKIQILDNVTELRTYQPWALVHVICATFELQIFNSEG